MMLPPLWTGWRKLCALFAIDQFVANQSLAFRKWQHHHNALVLCRTPLIIHHAARRAPATAASQQYPPLCSVLEQLVSTLELSNKELVLAALRDKQVPFDVLAKESTGSLTSFF